jgi:hypothetical protein
MLHKRKVFVHHHYYSVEYKGLQAFVLFYRKMKHNFFLQNLNIK